MNKEAIRKLFEEQIASDLGKLIQSALAAKEAATHSESKAEDQYDTRGLEASYLAGAQATRVSEMEELLNVFRHLDLKNFTADTPISATAIVELISEEKALYCFLMPLGGGRTTTYEGKLIQVTTRQSPLGRAILGKKAGDEIEVTTNATREYQIRQVW